MDASGAPPRRAVSRSLTSLRYAAGVISPAPRSKLLLVALGLSACAPTPQLEIAPDLLSSEWRGGATAGALPLDAAWSAFGAPELAALVAQASQANPDIAIATARLLQARGQLRSARAATAPSLALAGTAGAFSGSDSGGDLGERAIGLDLAYEVDLFGRARAGKRAARARHQAARFDRDSVSLAIESEVARAYVQHAAFSARIRLLERALENARELDRIIAVRVREGVATRVDSGLQTVELRGIEAEISRLVQARARTRNALAILVGEEAPRFAAPEADLDALSVPEFLASQPGALLTRRPDIRAAEARIAAAEGDVERARSAFLPGLRLSAGSLLDAAGPLQLGVAVGAGLLAPIFDGGRLKGDLLSASGAQHEAVERYRKALLVALGEGEDALDAVEQSRRRDSLLAETLATARVTARLARRQYVEGAADLQTLLDAERRALDVEDALAVARQERLEAAIDLYRALGGRPARSGESY